MKSQALPITAPPHSHDLYDLHALRARTVGALKGAAS
jgi:hypothetical protein